MFQYKDIGDRLFKLRYISDFGGEDQQGAWAEKLGFSPGVYSHWETGRTRIPIGAALQLREKIRGLTLDYIYLGGDDIGTGLGRRLAAAPDREPTKRGRRRKAK